MTNKILSTGLLATIIVMAWLFSGASFFGNQASQVEQTVLAPLAHAAPGEHDHDERDRNQTSGQQNG